MHQFFAYARARHAIYLRRAVGHPAPWTKDPILQKYRFCNVFRELDTTTIWWRTAEQQLVPNVEDKLLATVVFRWFNRITTGEAIFRQPSLGLGGEDEAETAWDFFLRTGDISSMRASILQYCGKGPYVTGSFIVKTPDGKDKLEGVLWCIEQFHKDWRTTAQEMVTCNPKSQMYLENVHEWLMTFPYLGHFMAYEIVTDLRHTALLNKAPDIMTWANPGPGALRGLNRLHGKLLRPMGDKHRQAEMRHLLMLSQLPEYWPQAVQDSITVSGLEMLKELETWPIMNGPETAWPRWEMRDVEHTLCEFDKYERVRLGEGRPRQIFRGAV